MENVVDRLEKMKKKKAKMIATARRFVDAGYRCRHCRQRKAIQERRLFYLLERKVFVVAKVEAEAANSVKQVALEYET